MPEQLTQVDTFRVDYRCDECGEPMAFQGVVLTSNPPQYPHKCVNGHTANLGSSYPTLSYARQT